jgi:hypothetical protein
MNQSMMLAVSAALGFCVAGISPVHAETSGAACGNYAWPHYPQQCLMKAGVVGVSSATVRLAVANPLGDPATAKEPARPVDLRFDDRNYFDPAPTYVEHRFVQAVLPNS